jgi:hypothetical protein
MGRAAKDEPQREQVGHSRGAMTPHEAQIGIMTGGITAGFFYYYLTAPGGVW